MPLWQGKSRGNPTGFRIFVWVLKKAGVAPAYVLLRFVAVYYFFFSPRAFISQYFFFTKQLRYSFLRAVGCIYKNYYWFGQTIIDRVVMLSGIAAPFEFEFEGEDFLRVMVEQKKGGLLLSAHIGNWEIAGHLLQRLGTDMHIVMYDGEQQQIKNYMETITGKNSAHIILIKEDLSHIYAIQEALAGNGFVCMHADRFLEGNKTITGLLLNKAALFPAGPFLLANVFHCPVSFVFAMKDRPFKYHFYASPSKIYAGDREISIPEMLRDYNQAVERTVLKYPLQWYNYYDFWKPAESPPADR